MKTDLYTNIKACRICGEGGLHEVLSFGEMCLTGKFPRYEEEVPEGPLTLVQCECGAVQLAENYAPEVLYNLDYGYRSGLNPSMIEHLAWLADWAAFSTCYDPDDIVLDIGSNDGTLLGMFGGCNQRLGIDPLANKFAEFYPRGVAHIADFFSAKTFEYYTNKKAKIVFSVAMLYDLADPRAFAQQIASILADDGVWCTEQAYLPRMLEQNAYDTICHEHLTYLTVGDLAVIAESAGLQILDLTFNDTNGGSFAAILGHKGSGYSKKSGLRDIIERESQIDLSPFCAFVHDHPDFVQQFLAKFKDRRVLGYGASTKGNVVLQHCDITPEQLPAILDVNPDKWGCRTPGTDIPIVGNVDPPDYFLVLPWHFKKFILQKERGSKFVFLLPKIEVCDVSC